MKRSALILAAALAVLGGWHLILRGHGRGLPLITDEGEYAVAAKSWRDGGLPYRDAFSQKPPLVLMLYRIPLSLSSSPEAVRSLGHFVSLLTLIVLFFAAPKYWSLESRLAGPASFAALAALPIGDYSFAANTEVFVNFFAVLSAVAVLKDKPLLAGLAAGAMLCSKQTSLWTLLCLGVMVVLTSKTRPLKRGLVYLGGAAVIPLSFAVYFFSQDAFAVYWRSVWSGNARYAAVLLLTGSLHSQLSWFVFSLLPSLSSYSLPSLFLSAVAFRDLKAGSSRPVETLAVLWIGGAFAGALTGLFLFPHYFLQLAPPLALAAACGVERMTGGHRAALAVLALWPALLAPKLYFLDDARTRAFKLLHPNPLFECKVLGETLKGRANPGDRLHVFGSEGSLFMYSGLAPATKHTLSYALTLFPESRASVDNELSALRSAPPRFVVWSTQPLSTMISSGVGEDYRRSLKAFVLRSYRYAGRMTVGRSSFAPSFESAPATAKPDFESDGQLLLFERAKLL